MCVRRVAICVSAQWTTREPAHDVVRECLRVLSGRQGARNDWHARAGWGAGRSGPSQAILVVVTKALIVGPCGECCARCSYISRGIERSRLVIEDRLVTRELDVDVGSPA